MGRFVFVRAFGWHVAVLTAFSVAALAALTLPSTGRVEAAGPLLFPAPAGSEWSIVAGYNTATHSVADKNDPYALDIVRMDAPTAGSQVLAPFDGTGRFSDSSCLSITDSAGVTALICHVFPVPGLRNRPILRGQVIATVAPAGQANNGGLPHIHIALSNSARGPIPFEGAYAIEGQSLPAITTSNGYSDVTFTSTNVAVAAPLTVDAGPDQQVRPGSAVTLNALASVTSGVTYNWRQTSGPSVSLSHNGASASFTAPSANNATLVFEVVAVNASAQTARETVTVRTSTSAPPVVQGGSATAAGTFLSSPVFSAQRLALAVYGGGSVDQLEAAARTASASGVWAQDSTGTYQLYVIDGASFLNATFRSRFASGFATATAVTLTRS